MKFLILFLGCSLLSFSQGTYVRTFNTNFFSAFGGNQSKKTISNGKDLVTWNIQTQPNDLPKIALMDSNMQVTWCKEYPVLNFDNSNFHIQTITFDENNNLLVCGNAINEAYVPPIPCSILIRLDRNNGNILWNTVVDSVEGVNAYGENKHIYFFGNKNRQNSIVTYLSMFDSTGTIDNWQCLTFSDSINGKYRVSDAMRFNKTQHLVYLSPLSENKNNNRCKLLCLYDHMNPIWSRGFKELGYAPENNRSLIAVSDTEFVVNNFERDSTLYKFNKKGHLIWGKKFNTGGIANPYLITGNLLLLSMPAQSGKEILVNESNGGCVSVNNNLPCEPLTGNYSNRLTYYQKTGLYQLCSAANYLAVTNGCAGLPSQLSSSNFNAVGIHHNYVSSCAFQSDVLPSSTGFNLTLADSTYSFPYCTFNTFFCNSISANPIFLNTVYVEEGCNLSMGLNNQQISEQQFKIFPNPAKNKIYVESSIKGNLQIINSNGQLVASFEITTEINEIDISFIAEGLYILKMINGTSVTTRKMIKE